MSCDRDLDAVSIAQAFCGQSDKPGRKIEPFEIQLSPNLATFMPLHQIIDNKCIISTYSPFEIGYGQVTDAGCGIPNYC